MDDKGNHYGLGPTIEEIDHLSKLFKKIYHCAPLHKGTPPKSFKCHDSKNVKYIPLAPAGGKNLFNKLANVYLFPKNLKIIKTNLIGVDWLHFRAPTGIGLMLLPWILLFWKKGIWVKYAGSWIDKRAPISYRLQRYILKLFPKRCKISINGNFENKRQNFHNFINPCFNYENLKKANSVSYSKDFKKKLKLIYVGRIEPKKGLDDIFKLLLNLENTDRIEDLTIIGESEDYSKYESLGDCLPFKVKITGPLSRKDVFNYFSKSDILLFLSKSEGFPKVVMEAGAYGCVPILSKIPNLEIYIKHGFNGFLLQNQSIVKSKLIFQNILSDPTYLKKISMEITRTSKLFTFENYLIKVSNRILNDR